MNWTAELKTKIADLWNHHSARQIANILATENGVRVSRNSIIGVLTRMGLSGTGIVRVREPKESRTRQAPQSIGPMLQKIRAKRMAIKPEPFVVSHCDVVPLRIQFAALEGFHCREAYDATAEETGSFVFCGHQCREGSSYCPSHHAKNFVKPNAPKTPYVQKHFARRAA